MNARIRSILVGTAVLAIAIAGSASAAPNRTVNLGPAHQAEGWTSALVTAASGWFWFDSADPTGSCGTFGAGPAKGKVTPMDYCDQTLVKLSEPGTLDVAIPDGGDGFVKDWDLFVYESDAAGNAGTLVDSSENLGGAEDVLVDGAAGNYLVIAIPYQSVNDSYGGAVTWSPADEG